MKKCKHFGLSCISLILAICFVVGLCPMRIKAEEEATADKYLIVSEGYALSASNTANYGDPVAWRGFLASEYDAENPDIVEPMVWTIAPAGDDNITIRNAVGKYLVIISSENAEGKTIPALTLTDEETTWDLSNGKLYAKSATLGLMIDTDEDEKVTGAFFYPAPEDNACPVSLVKVHEIKTSGNVGGLVIPVSGVYVADGKDYSVKIAASTDYLIESVKVDGEEITLTNTAEMEVPFTAVTEDHTVDVLFKTEKEIVTHTILAKSDENGKIEPTGEVTVGDGESQEFTFTPNEGYEIDKVLVDGTAVTPTDGMYTIENVTTDMEIEVTYKEITPVTHTILAKSGENGKIEPTGEVTVNDGESQKFTFTPDEGYKIDEVRVDGAVVTPTDGAYTIENVTTDMEIEVTFKTFMHTITVAAGSNGTIDPDDNVELDTGEDAEFTFAANDNYEIDKVLIDGVANEEAKVAGKYKFENVTADHSIAVTFKALPKYTITVTAGEHGTVNPSENTIVSLGGNAKFTFTADDDCAIEKVLIDGEENAEAKAAGEYTFENVTADHSIEVTFTVLPKYTITVTAGENGVISPAEDTDVTEGKDAEFIITPDEGYEIDKVLIDGEENEEAKADGKYTFENVTEAHSVEATFKIRKFTVTPAKAVNGTLIPSEPQTVEYGGSVTFTFEAAIGCRIKEVKVGENAVEYTGNTYTLSNIKQDEDFEVVFEPIPSYTITPIAGEHGKIEPGTPTAVVENSDKVFTVTPDKGYEIDTVLVDDEPVTLIGDRYYFTNVDANHTIEATFKPIYHMIAAYANDHGSISPKGDIRVVESTTQTFTFTPDENYEVDVVKVNGTPVEVTDNTYTTDEILNDLTISVSFRLIKVAGVSLDETARITIGTKEALNAVISPANAVNQNLTWASDNTAVATVSASGVVTAVSLGKATITVTTEDGGKTASCAVTVVPVQPTTDKKYMIISSDSYALAAGDFAGVPYTNGTKPTDETTWALEEAEDGAFFLKNGENYLSSSFTENEDGGFDAALVLGEAKEAWTLTDDGCLQGESGFLIHLGGEDENAFSIGETGEKVTFVEVREFPLGDVTGDGFVDSDDAMIILRYDAQYTVKINLNYGDVTGDGFVDSDDAMFILRYDAGLITEFPAARD